MSWQLNDLTFLTGAPPADGRPTGHAFPALGTRHVNYVGMDSHIHELWWRDNTWHHDDLTNLTGSPLATNIGKGYVFRCTRHLNYLGLLPGALGELWKDHIGWHFTDLGSATGGVINQTTGAATGYAFPQQGTQHVNFPDAQHIHEYWWDGTGWHHHDLTDAANAPLAGGNPTGYMFEAQGTQHVNYVGNDHHVHELWWNRFGWHHKDLTIASGGAPLAENNRNTPGYMFPALGTQHVNYVGVDGHIHELWWDQPASDLPGAWHHNDLTAATGAPDSPSNAPVGYTFAGTQHVQYVATDGHVHDLVWDYTGWHHGDLTNATGPHDVYGGAISSYVFEEFGTQHVNFRDGKGHVIELLWTPD